MLPLSSTKLTEEASEPTPAWPVKAPRARYLELAGSSIPVRPRTEPTNHGGGPASPHFLIPLPCRLSRLPRNIPQAQPPALRSCLEGRLLRPDFSSHDCRLLLFLPQCLAVSSLEPRSRRADQSLLLGPALLGPGDWAAGRGGPEGGEEAEPGESHLGGTHYFMAPQIPRHGGGPNQDGSDSGFYPGLKAK